MTGPSAGPALRRLSEMQTRRTLCAGGMMRQVSGVWQVYGQTDARGRIAGIVSPLIAARLIACDAVREIDSQSGRWVACQIGSSGWQAQLPASPPELPARRKGALPRQSLLEDILQTEGIPEKEAIRLRAAATRFMADMEDAVPRRIHGGTDRLRANRSAAALTRLKAMEKAFGLADFRQIEALFAAGATRRSFAWEVGCQPEDVAAKGMISLRQLARAYNLQLETL